MIDYNHKEDWFYEGQISKKLVQYFIDNGYKIDKDNSANISARGEDIIVSKKNEKEIIEVKGYPTTKHTKGEKKGEDKITSPRAQAKHWFSEALLSSIFNYKKHKDANIAVAFPKMDRYEELIIKVEDFFTDKNIDFKIYFVDKDGNVTLDNLNKRNGKSQRINN